MGTDRRGLIFISNFLTNIISSSSLDRFVSKQNIIQYDETMAVLCEHNFYESTVFFRLPKQNILNNFPALQLSLLFHATVWY